jgi:dCMP deaminase
MVNIKIKRLKPEAIIPRYEHEGDAGMDLFSTEDYTLRPGERCLVSTGLAFEIPHGTELQIRPRSGLALKKGISIVNSPATLDCGYRGELGIVLINHGMEDFGVRRGDKIAQAILNRIEVAEIEESDMLSESERGDRGFGSSGGSQALIDKNSVELQELREEGPRLGWDEYFIEISRTIAKRATCNRGRSGCVIVKDKQILVSGYVGAPRGLPHCDEAGHKFEETIHFDGEKRNHCVRTTHAEQNAICQAAKRGISIEGATLYCKMTPCAVCAKMIINAGIKRVVCEKKYHAGEESEELFSEAGVQLDILVSEVESYENQ